MSFTVPQNSISCFIGRVDEVDKNFVTNGILWVDFDDLDGTKNGKPRTEDGTTIQKVCASWTLRSAYAAWENPPKIEYRGELVLEGGIELKDTDIEIDLPNADISINGADIQLYNLLIQGGPPLQGTVMTPVGPGGIATVPVTISAAVGSGKCSIINNTLGHIKCSSPLSSATIRAGSSAKNNSNSVKNCTATLQTTDRKEYTVTLTATKQSVSPWCTSPNSKNAGADKQFDDDVRLKRSHFILDKVNDNHPHGGDKVLCMAFGNSMNNLYAVDIFI